MESSTLTLGGLVYDLDPGTVITTLKDTMERTALSGGGFVDLDVVGEDFASVFVSPGTSIYFTTNDVSESTHVDLSPTETIDWELGFYGL
ncbi:hypothetical protein [Plantibacter sp. ME-Dv--P-122b]|uniref:hypothetical protein n=1 Tax=Plantibacter sp. ME-Dv--P-122b TaxID=3040300 RepID=UPI0025510A9C|nr:hypothetical protein [Plantibacter sp. ME-Dv--P-122b]